MKLVLREQNSKKARETVNNYLKKGYSLYTTDIALAESLNAIWKHTTIHKDLKPEDAKKAAQDLIKTHSKLGILPTEQIATETMHTALSLNTPVYDAIYIATTQKLNATLYTADKKLHNIASKTTNTQILNP